MFLSRVVSGGRNSSVMSDLSSEETCLSVSFKTKGELCGHALVTER